MFTSLLFAKEFTHRTIQYIFIMKREHVVIERWSDGALERIQKPSTRRIARPMTSRARMRKSDARRV